MKKLISTLFVSSFVVACAGGGGSGSSGLQYTGKPSDFNGDWTGPGSASTEHWQQDGLRYTLHISKTPRGADIYYAIEQADGKSFSLGSVVGHYAVGNILYATDTRSPVGEIGQDGFIITRPGVGRFEGSADAFGRLTLKGYLEYGETKIYIQALLER